MMMGEGCMAGDWVWGWIIVRIGLVFVDVQDKTGRQID